MLNYTYRRTDFLYDAFAYKFLPFYANSVITHNGFLSFISSLLHFQQYEHKHKKIYALGKQERKWGEREAKWKIVNVIMNIE